MKAFFGKAPKPDSNRLPPNSHAVSNDDVVAEASNQCVKRRKTPKIPNLLFPNRIPVHDEKATERGEHCRHCKLLLILFKPWRSVFPTDDDATTQSLLDSPRESVKSRGTTTCRMLLRRFVAG